LVFDIFQGIGIAAAIGMRPFLPSVAAGALAAGDIEIRFDHTSFSFLQSTPFLLVMVILTALLVVTERDQWRRVLPKGGRAGLIAAFSLALAAVFFAGALARGGYAAWPGYVGGVICAGVAIAAFRPFLARLRGRLDDAAAAVGVPVIADGAALVVAVVSVLVPPLGVIALLALIWMLFGGRRRDRQKYAGLRILR
jgi:hypothetical protein